MLKKQLGNNIKLLRKQKKLTQEQFAEYIGIDPKNVSKIENGKNYPTADTLNAIAKALQVEYYELFLFNKKIPYEQMKKEVVSALEDKTFLLSAYKLLHQVP